MVFSHREPQAIYLVDKGKPACLIRCMTPSDFAAWKNDESGASLAWAETTNFSASAGEILLLPDSAGGLSGVLLGVGSQADAMALAALPAKLPPGAYRLADGAPAAVAANAALAWTLGCYRFTKYKSSPNQHNSPACAVQIRRPSA